MLKEVFYPKGTLIWEEGSTEQGLQIIDSGKVKVTRMTQEGNRQVLAVLKANKFFGELSILDGRAHSASMEATGRHKGICPRKNRNGQTSGGNSPDGL